MDLWANSFVSLWSCGLVAMPIERGICMRISQEMDDFTPRLSWAFLAHCGAIIGDIA
jgi:hypothetical protein